MEVEGIREGWKQPWKGGVAVLPQAEGGIHPEEGTEEGATVSKQTRRGWNDSRICAADDCTNTVTRKGLWLCDDCEAKEQEEADRYERLKSASDNLKSEERRGK